MPHSRLGCSSITFRRRPLDEALGEIRASGFAELDLGALPGVCDHVPYALDEQAIESVAAEVHASGLTVRSVNGDIGDLNTALSEQDARARREHLGRLLDLSRRVGARALVLPCGAIDNEPAVGESADIALVAEGLIEAAGVASSYGVEVWCETLHFHRLCCTIDRAGMLTERLRGSGVKVVMDFSHIVASGADPVDFVDRFSDVISHVHLRDATLGDINLSLGNGEVDFAAGIRALERHGFDGHFSLELETHDVEDDDRSRATRAAAELISPLIDSAAQSKQESARQEAATNEGEP